MIKSIYNRTRYLYKKIRCKISKEYAYWEGAYWWYYKRTGKELNYKNPHNLCEKLMWLSRYWQHPSKSECADKYLVRNYVKQCGFQDILIPIYGVWNNAEDIDFTKLPEQFVLKCNHGCGYNIICKDKSKIKQEEIIQKLNSWMNETYGLKSYEVHYSKITPRIICEMYLPSLEEHVIDYKIYCINGNPDNILVCHNRKANGHSDISAYSLDWKRLSYLKESSDSKKDITKPKQLQRMIEIAKKLSEPFPFVRVDLYEIDAHIYFGELTFTPKGNILDDYKDDVLIEMGEKLILPSKFR